MLEPNTKEKHLLTWKRLTDLFKNLKKKIIK